MRCALKAVILAGGLGTRLAEETVSRPKPLVQIGSMPIIWHIMKVFSHFGVNEFIICAGYKGEMIKEFFSNLHFHGSDVTFKLGEGGYVRSSDSSDDWLVHVVETGERSMTGGRLKRVARFLDDNNPFFMTYGDGLADIDIKRLLEFHLNHGKQATLTSVIPPARFGALEIERGSAVVTAFNEKLETSSHRINGGFFVLDPQVLELIDDDYTVWEQQPLSRLAFSRELMAFEHNGFWQPMDTVREKTYLNKLWTQGQAPWKVW